MTIEKQIEYIQGIMSKVGKDNLYPISDVHKRYVADAMLNQLCFLLRMIDDEKLPESWTNPEIREWLFDIAQSLRLRMDGDQKRRYRHDVDVRELLRGRT